MINDTSMHRQTWDQIPWIVNGTLPDEDRLAVGAHLENCADCREELEFQRRLAIAMDTNGTPDIDPSQSWQRLRDRIDAAQERTERPHVEVKRRLRTGSGQWIPWLVAAMVVQAIGLGAIGTSMWAKPSAQSASVYKTLSAAEPAAGNATIRVVFASDLSVGKMQALLMASGLTVQSGPSSEGVWSLAPAGDSSRSSTHIALRQLRDSPEVRFAEVIGGSP